METNCTPESSYLRVVPGKRYNLRTVLEEAGAQHDGNHVRGTNGETVGLAMHIAGDLEERGRKRFRILEDGTTWWSQVKSVVTLGGLSLQRRTLDVTGSEVPCSLRVGGERRDQLA